MSIGGLFKDIDVMWENLLHASNTTLSPLRILRIKLEVDYGLDLLGMIKHEIRGRSHSVGLSRFPYSDWARVVCLVVGY